MRFVTHFGTASSLPMTSNENEPGVLDAIGERLHSKAVLVPTSFESAARRIERGHRNGLLAGDAIPIPIDTALATTNGHVPCLPACLRAHLTERRTQLEVFPAIQPLHAGSLPVTLPKWNQIRECQPKHVSYCGAVPIARSYASHQRSTGSSAVATAFRQQTERQ